MAELDPVSFRPDQNAADQLRELVESSGLTRGQVIRLAIGEMYATRKHASGEIRALLDRLAEEHGADARLEFVPDGDVTRVLVGGKEVAEHDAPAFSVRGEQSLTLYFGKREQPGASSLAAIPVSELSQRDLELGTSVARSIRDLLRSPLLPASTGAEGDPRAPVGPRKGVQTKDLKGGNK